MKSLTVRAQDDLETVAFKVCTALDRRGIRAVLCGGSAATIYAPEAYQSRDVDFIASFWGREEQRDDALLELGYRNDGRVYVCDDQLVTLDFPNDELLLGDELLTETNTLHRDDWILTLLTPFDCVRDRLSWHFFYQRKDLSALSAAVAVTLNQGVDANAVRLWAQANGVGKRLEEYFDLVARWSTRSELPSE